ncbi:hypothetical protein HPB51_008147 [Rhipicephalus microplus]|uniref:Uncharacterized protein n=1 Tax=Rhipicephalus microplus TaxID=6941 RepID=A0A9J6D4E9_RHIMP|nr:hypothetical protein HPB51_008147 [Rhipicephalus microplus]
MLQKPTVALRNASSVKVITQQVTVAAAKDTTSHMSCDDAEDKDATAPRKKPTLTRGRSWSRCPGKKMTWADMVRDSGSAPTTPTTSKQGKVQPEHVADPRIHTLERENKALKQELAELKATLARLEGRILKDTPPPIPQSSGSVVASCSPNKRRAVNTETDDDTSDVDDFMSDVSEAPSNALASDNKAKKHRKTKNSIVWKDQLLNPEPREEFPRRTRGPCLPRDPNLRCRHPLSHQVQ